MGGDVSIRLVCPDLQLKHRHPGRSRLQIRMICPLSQNLKGCFSLSMQKKDGGKAPAEPVALPAEVIKRVDALTKLQVGAARRFCTKYS